MQAEPSAIVYRAAVAPPARVLVMLPGYGAPPLAFTGYIQNTDALPDTEIVFVQYGFTFTSFEDLARRVWDMLLSLGYGTSRLVIMGYSMGGMLAQTLAKQQSASISAVILISTGTAVNGSLPLTLRGKILKAVHAIFSLGSRRTDDDGSDPRGMVPASMAGTRDEQAMLRNLIGRTSVSNTVNSNAQMRSMITYMNSSKGKTMAEQVKGLTHPMLILHGSADSVLDVKSARELHAALPTTSTLMILPNAGHGMIFEHAAQINAIINNWLLTLPATGSSSSQTAPAASSKRQYSFASVRNGH